MTRDELLAQLRREPFAPITIRTAEGQELPVYYHPGQVSVGGDRIAVGVWEGRPQGEGLPDSFRFVALEDIVAMGQARPAPRPA
ncbi:MAG TPA: hypothetical protein VFE78_10620 [Gemmataceae bacterium]|jgi:hypothetical protein|nr:hypothetical protein [Gemmataceae bacterium]